MRSTVGFKHSSRFAVTSSFTRIDSLAWKRAQNTHTSRYDYEDTTPALDIDTTSTYVLDNISCYLNVYVLPATPGAARACSHSFIDSHTHT